MSGPRFRVAPGSLDGEFVDLADDEAHHLYVMRLQPGAAVGLFDGVGAAAAGVVEQTGPDAARVRVLGLEPAQGESPVAITLVQAVPVKFQRLDDTVRLCTELGVAEILPVVSAHTQLPSGGLAVIERRVVRWRRIAESAAKQSGRAVIPRIGVPGAFADLNWANLSPARFLLEPTAATSLVAELGASKGESCALLVGPEGGWAADERALALQQGASEVTMGPRVLRADSAGPAALALVQAAWGDLG
jgi:16S rRNA (uracil1498-N3)-methyltransferase